MDINKNEQIIDTLIRQSFTEIENLDWETKYRRSLENASRLIFGILISPTFTPIEYGALLAYLSIWLSLNAGVRSFDDAKDMVTEMIGAYLDIMHGKKVSEKIQEYIDYYKLEAQINNGQ